MVYHEIREVNGRKHNYLVSNAREGKKWKKKSKYIGEGELSRQKIKKEIENFEIILIENVYLSKSQILEIDRIKKDFDAYLKKSGKLGIEKYEEWFFTELTYNSNAIEGNTLSLQDTSLIINDGLAPKGASLREIHEAKNHKEALEFLREYKGDLDEKLILRIHSFILEKIYDRFAGKYRRTEVRIRGSDFKPPKSDEVPLLVTDLIKWYKKNKNKLHPFELAVLTSAKLVTIHPFVDGNGRVSRLVMNFILKRKNYPEINVYVKDRSDYLDAIRKANDEDYTLIMEFLYKTLKKNYNFLFCGK